MNLPNKLTVSRMGLTVAFLAAMFARFPFSNTVALVFFVTASITDWMDGSIARSRKLITNFGILMDPLADKILICSAFIAFVDRGYMPAWMVVVIVARELAITGLRTLAASKQIVLAAEGYGKNKTISQITAIISALTPRQLSRVGSHRKGNLRIPHFPFFLGLLVHRTCPLGRRRPYLHFRRPLLWRNRSLYADDV